MQLFTNLLELEALAREHIEPGAFDYIAGGADDEVSLHRNHSDFDRITLRPRVLVDVSNVDTSTSVLGIPISLPVMLAPTAGHKLCCDDGELATARGAAMSRTGMILSTLATTRLEDVAAASACPKMFQLYVYKDKEITRMLVQRAEEAGYLGLCLTVDVPYIGHRERDLRNAYSFPHPLANFVEVQLENMPVGVVGKASGLGSYIASKWDPSLSWKDVDWLCSITKLPVLVKGVLTGEDGALAVEHGARCVVVSNHGGRQLDSAPSGIAALPEVVEAVDGRVEVLMDGGVRRGTDVLKALALGAKAVLIGRPYMYGLALGGADGV
ncbi:MAG: alpha-hydroxy-acid oxidizing protein, partial [Chloroflexota bacterium]|nr:alpha-hydroxy-acid oxidizing protein [Chloroflexota bacterium]